jgi:hypothetical protein
MTCTTHAMKYNSLIYGLLNNAESNSDKTVSVVLLVKVIPTHLASQEFKFYGTQCSQEPTTGLCSEVDEYRIHTLTLYSQH